MTPLARQEPLDPPLPGPYLQSSMMTPPPPAANGQRLSPADLARAKQVWERYQQEHDLSAHHGRVAAIDPASGRVVLADAVLDIILPMQEQQGYFTPLHYVRVGCSHLDTNGGRP